MRALAFKLDAAELVAVVVSAAGDRIVIDAVTRIPLAAGVEGARAAGAQLGGWLAAQRLGKLPAVAVAPRAALAWLSMELPPAPADDLSDMVRLQAQRDVALSDDGLGFDYLPLSGGVERPWQVLGLGAASAELGRIRSVAAAADAKAERIVPEPLGWPALAASHSPSAGGDDSLQIHVACLPRQAVVWANVGGALRVIRTLVPGGGSPADDAPVLAGELRRTLLALAAEGVSIDAAAPCTLWGAEAPSFAPLLSASLGRRVIPAEFEQRITSGSGNQDRAALVELAPLAALAAEFARGNRAAVDLLHPRRRPAPPNRTRIYLRAALAMAAVLMLTAMHLWRSLQEPQDAATAARSELTALQSELSRRASDETAAAEVADWFAGSQNLLVLLDDLSRSFREQPLSAAAYPAAADIAATRVNVSGRQTTIAAAAKTSDVLRGAEDRLRAAGYEVSRGPVDFASTALPEYPVGVTVTAYRIAADEASAEAPAATPSEKRAPR